MSPTSSADTSKGQALAGVRVLEVASYTAGPLTCELLAQLGAEVIKVEPPWGDHIRTVPYRVGAEPHIFHFNNAGKRCVTADVKKEAGRDLVLRLAERSDVYVENFAPGAMERYGLGYEEVRAVAPEIIYGSLNGFASVGPLSGKRAYDAMIQGLAGIVGLTGPYETPVKVGPSVADVTSAIACATALTAAIYDQQRTGRGQRVEMAMFDLVAWLTHRVWSYLLGGERPPHRDGNRDYFAAPQNLFEASDGPFVVAVESDEQWRALADLIGRRDWSEEARFRDVARRRSGQDEIDAAIQHWADGRARQEIVDACQARGIPAAPVLNLDDVVDQPQLAARGAWVELPDISGEHVLRLPNSPYRMSRSPGRIERCGEPVGASTREVYRELGCSEQELDAWAEQGVT
jgi:crotonobetainyl-CoA:carnitine CoA-transferase CaiB-like acyl-CoA transferase